VAVRVDADSVPSEVEEIAPDPAADVEDAAELEAPQVPAVGGLHVEPALPAGVAEGLEALGVLGARRVAQRLFHGAHSRARRGGSALPGLALRGALGVLLLALAFRLALGGEAGGLARLAGAFVVTPGETLAWLGLACALLGGSFAAGAARFSTLLRSAGIAASFGSLLRGYLVAGFFNLVLPGAILGDAWRVWDVRAGTGRGSEALAIVALERLVSLVALALLALAAVPFLPLAAELGWVRGALAGSAGACFAASAFALHPAGIALARSALARARWIGPRVAGALGRALEALAGLAARPAELAAAFAWSAVAQGLTVLAVFCLGMPLGSPVPFPWYAAIVPSVALLATLPLSIGGAGVREVLYVACFGAVGMRPEAALGLSLAVFAVSLVWGGVGLALFLAGRRKPA
jgi:hypothetical protein